MKKVLFLILTSLATVASACDSISWAGDHRDIKTCYSKKLNATISADCIDQLNCWASKLKKENLIKKQESNSLHMITTPNPGSALCEQLNGTVLILTQTTGHQASFCEGPDKSVIDLYSLYLLLKAPDHKARR